MEKFISKNEKKIIAAAFVFFTAVYVSLIWNNNVWMDEAFTASLVHTDFTGVIERSMNDTLPPLYNIFLKIMTDIFGYTIPVMKMTSVIPMIGTLLIGATTTRKRFGVSAALLFMSFLTFMPLMLYYGVEIRMYSLGFFFATAAGVYAYEVAAEPSRKNWIIFTLFSVLAGYSHHFAFVTVAFAYLYLLLYHFFADRKHLKNWFWCLLATFILYLPCLIVTLGQISRVSGYFSMPDIDIHMFLQYVAYPFIVGFTPATLICALLMTLSLVLLVTGLIHRTGDTRIHIFSLCCFSVYYGVLLFGTIISKIMTANIFVDRYLFFSAGLLWLSAAVMLSDRGKLTVLALVAALAVGICVYFVEYRTEYGQTADEEITFLRDNVKEGDVYYSIGGHEEMQNCIPFYTYLDSKTCELTFVTPLEEAIITAEDTGVTLWISVLDGYSPSEDDVRTLEKYGLKMKKEADFEFDRYKCEMYRVTQ